MAADDPTVSAISSAERPSCSYWVRSHCASWSWWYLLLLLTMPPILQLR